MVWLLRMHFSAFWFQGEKWSKFWLPTEHSSMCFGSWELRLSSFASQRGRIAGSPNQDSTLTHILVPMRTLLQMFWLPRCYLRTCFGSQDVRLSCFNQPKGQIDVVSMGFCFWELIFFKFGSKKGTLGRALALQKITLGSCFDSQEIRFSCFNQSNGLWPHTFAPESLHNWSLAQRRALKNLFWLPRGRTLSHFGFHEGTFECLAPKRACYYVHNAKWGRLVWFPNQKGTLTHILAPRKGTIANVLAPKGQIVLF